MPYMSRGKKQQLAGHALVEAVNAGDAVADGNHRARFGKLDLADVALDLAFDDFTDFCCADLRPRCLILLSVPCATG